MSEKAVSGQSTDVDSSVSTRVVDGTNRTDEPVNSGSLGHPTKESSDHEFLFFWGAAKLRYLVMSNDHEFYV